MQTKSRRFGVHALKGGLQVATRRYREFHRELTYLYHYLNARLLPAEPEEVQMAGVVSNLQNILEHEAEELIRTCIGTRGTAKERAFLKTMNDGYVSFKSKCDWLLDRELISGSDWNVMDEVRILRNDFAHARPKSSRRRLEYKRYSLLTLRSLRQLLVDVEGVLRRLRERSGRKSDWMTVPPGFATEMGWPQDYIDVLEPR